MKEFKIGDEAFYFTDSSCNQLDPFDIEIEGGIIREELLGTVKTNNHWCEEIQLDWAFKSKNEAIDAMIKQLERMRDET